MIGVSTESLNLSQTQLEKGTQEKLPPGSSMSCSWGYRFKVCMEKLLSITMYTNLDEVININTELMLLSDDFVNTAKRFGKLIISESYLPIKQKTIVPTTIGGIVGGEKYIVHDILFKFAIDKDFLFDGNDLAASKVSKQELKGLMTYFGLEIPNIFFPMMALVNYRGFTLVAMTLLPVDSSTIVYGSPDGGATVYNSNQTFMEVMKNAGERLNLQPHLCGVEKEKTVELASAADIEGHLGFDGSLYLLDFGRAMPPVKPDKKFKNGHIYQLFRREFLACYHTPLCSDAYSRFAIHDSNLKKFNADVDSATTRLFTVVIPDCGKILFGKLKQYGSLRSIVEMIHQIGINLRYIGKLIDSVTKLKQTSPSVYKKELVETISTKLLIEATARAIKNRINADLRNFMKKMQEPRDIVYRHLCVHFLNLVFGNHALSYAWWLNTLSVDLQRYFSVRQDHIIEVVEGEEICIWRKRVLCPEEKIRFGKDLISVKFAVFQRVINLCKIRVTLEGLQNIRVSSRMNSEKPLDLLDVTSLGSRVKHMEIVPRTKGVFFQLMSLKEKHLDVSYSLLIQSISFFKSALENMPANRNSLLYCALSWYRCLEVSALNLSRRKPKLSVNTPSEIAYSLEPQPLYFDLADPTLYAAENLFNRMIKLDTNNSIAITIAGKFFANCHNFEFAEECFLRALECNQNCSFARVSYGLFMYTHGTKMDGLRLIESAPNRNPKPSLSNLLFGYDSLVSLPILFHDGSPYNVVVPLNFTSSAVISKILEDPKVEAVSGVLVEVVKKRHPLAPSDFQKSITKKNSVLKKLEQDEIPWILLVRHESLIYFLSV